MCDTLAAVGPVTAGGLVLFGKNSDREYNEAQYLQLIPAAKHPPGTRVHLTYVDIDQAPMTHAVLLSKPHWIWGAEIGANAHGLLIGNEAVFAKIEASSAYGIIGMDYLRLALERASTVDEAVGVITGLLRTHGQSGNCGFKKQLTYHNSFIIADPRGAKILETVDREWVVRSITNYDAISNSFTTESDYEQSSPTLRGRAAEANLPHDAGKFSVKHVFEDPVKNTSGAYRRARALSLLKSGAGALRVHEFFTILRDHLEGPRPPDRPSGPRICTHTRDNPLGQTTASWVAALGIERCMHWVTGTSAPCTGIFKPIFLETGLPQHGPIPGEIEESRSLWWRHEQLCRRLDAANLEAQHTYITERDGLEKIFLERIQQCPAPTDHDSRLEADRLVNLCWAEALEFEHRWLDHLDLKVSS